MRITVESTDKLVELVIADAAGFPTVVMARVWQGETDSGVPVQAFITRIAPEIPESDPRIGELTGQFERELMRTATPRPTVAAIPLRLII